MATRAKFTVIYPSVNWLKFFILIQRLVEKVFGIRRNGRMA